MELGIKLGKYEGVPIWTHFGNPKKKKQMDIVSKYPKTDFDLGSPDSETVMSYVLYGQKEGNNQFDP